MVKYIYYAAAFLMAVIAAQVQAATCYFYVEGHTYIDGPCVFTPLGEGSFQISAGDDPATAPYFADVLLTGKGIGDAYWNESPDKRHAHSDLGPVTRNGACWENELAQICAQE